MARLNDRSTSAGRNVPPRKALHAPFGPVFREAAAAAHAMTYRKLKAHTTFKVWCAIILATRWKKLLYKSALATPHSVASLSRHCGGS